MSKKPAEKMTGRYEGDLFIAPTDYDKEERVAICKVAVTAARANKRVVELAEAIVALGGKDNISGIYNFANRDLQPDHNVQELEDQYQYLVEQRWCGVPKAPRPTEEEIRLASNPSYKYEYAMVFKLVTIDVGSAGDKEKEKKFDASNKDPEYKKSARWPAVARNILKSLLEADMSVFTYISAQGDELFFLITVGEKALWEFADDKDYLLELDEDVCEALMEIGNHESKWKPRYIMDISDQADPVTAFHIKDRTKPDQITLETVRLGAQGEKFRQHTVSKWHPYRYIYGTWESDVILEGIPEEDFDNTPLRSIYKLNQDAVLDKDGNIVKPATGPTTDENGNKIFSPFTFFERRKLVAQMIQADFELNKGAGIPLLKLLQKNQIDAFFPLHDPATKRILQHEGMHFLQFPWGQNFNNLRNYFGEKVAFYYLFIGHYSKWLVVPGLIGTAFQLVVWGSGPNFSHPVLPCYGALICVWSICMLEYWKRTQSHVAMQWGVSEFEAKETERVEFKGAIISSVIDGKYVLFFPEGTKRNLVATSTIAIGTLILVVVGAVAGIYVMKFALSKTIGSNASTVTSVVNTIQITIFNMLYTSLANVLVDYENHSTQTKWTDSLIGKIFMFQFVNSYASFFFIAFIAAQLPRPDSTADVNTDGFLGQCGASNCMYPLSINLAILFGSRLIISNVTEVLSTWSAKVSRTKENKKGLTDEQVANLSPAEKDYWLLEYDVNKDSIACFADTAIQYGFVVLFTVALPISTMAALVSNHVKIKIQVWKQFSMFQRPIPLGAQDIGTWQSIFYILSIVAVCTNAGLICFTMDVLWKNSQVLPVTGTTNSNLSVGDFHRAGFSLTGRLWVFIGFIVTLIAFQFLASEIIPDETIEVITQKQRQEFIRNKIIENAEDPDYAEVQGKPVQEDNEPPTGCLAICATNLCSKEDELEFKSLSVDVTKHAPMNDFPILTMKPEDISTNLVEAKSKTWSNAAKFEPIAKASWKEVGHPFSSAGTQPAASEIVQPMSYVSLPDLGGKQYTVGEDISEFKNQLKARSLIDGNKSFLFKRNEFAEERIGEAGVESEFTAAGAGELAPQQIGVSIAKSADA